ncbi:MAG TPA: hypothetical protein VIU12_21405 [Chryseolinea sp.]
MLNRIKHFFVYYGTEAIIIVFLVASGAIGFLAQFWLKKENLNISNETRNIYAAIVGIGTGMLGYLANLLVSRQKDANTSTSEILEKVAKNLAVSPMHKRKLVALAKDALNSWRTLLAVPKGGDKFSNEFFSDGTSNKRKFARINLDSLILETRCPSIDTLPILFFNTYEISGGIPNFVAPTEIAATLSQQIALLNVRVPQSTALFQILSHDKLEKNIRIWVKVPNYTICTVSQIDDVLNAISSVFRNIFSEFQLTVELYAAKDIRRENTEVSIDPGDKIIPEENQLPAALYTLNRNIFFERLSHQRIFGNLELPILQIPFSLMQSRLQDVRRETSGTWNSIVISGSPGTGKTELVYLFVQEYAPTSNDYFIFCNSTEIYRLLENPKTYHSQSIFFSSISEFMADHDSVNNPGAANQTLNDHRSAYKDALLNRLNKGFNKIVLVVDDLESNNEVKGFLTQKHDLLIGWGVKLILISRSKMPDIKVTSTMNLSLWTRPEANSILAEWNRNIDLNDISLQRYISESENSSYLLRIIARRNEPNKSVDEMLREELEDILDPLKRYYGRIKSSPEALLLELKSRIQQEADHSTLLAVMEEQANIDIIDLMSKIAWYTKFNTSLIGHEKDEQKYRSGLIKPSVVTKFAKLTDDQAESFIEICIKLRIMSGTKEAAIWIDHLVPDGAIALKLKKDIVANIDRNIHEQQILTLDKSQSLGFLTALIDIPLFDALLELHSTFSLKKLLTARVSRYLTHNPETFNPIATSIFNFTENLQEQQQEEWLPIIGALYPNSRFIQQHCHESIVSNRNTDYYLSILLDQLNLDDVSQRYLEVVGTTKMAGAALKYGKKKDWVEIVNLVLYEYVSNPNSLPAEWKIFISRTELSSLAQLMDLILERCFPHPTSPSDFSKLDLQLISEIFERLKKVYSEPHGKERYDTLSGPIIQAVGKKLKFLIDHYENFTQEFNILVKWLLYHHHRDLTNLDADYQLKKIGSDHYAIPNTCQPSMNNFAAIRDNIRQGFPRFKLPRAIDLSPDIKLPNELISDGFPPDYDYSSSRALLPYAWKKIRDDRRTVVSLTETERKNEYLLHWRAIFKL